jgi:hypothetical protein
MFHETWASGPVWSSVFWQQPEQRRCAARLLELADAAVTSNMATYRDLDSLNTGKRIALIPLGVSFPNLRERSRSAVKDWRRLLVVGREGSRARALSAHRRLLRELARTELVRAVVLAGECSERAASSEMTLWGSLGFADRIATAYNFASDAVPESVLESGLSLMHADSACLLKSTSFHLAAACGQVPIALETLPPGEPLELDRHYLGYESSDYNRLVERLRDLRALEEMAGKLSALDADCFAWSRLAERWREIFVSAPADGGR